MPESFGKTKGQAVNNATTQPTYHGSVLRDIVGRPFSKQHQQVVIVETSSAVTTAITTVFPPDVPMQTWTITHKAADRVENNKISASLKTGNVKLLAVELPAPGRDLSPEKLTHFARIMSSWVAAAKPHLQSGTSVVIVGTFGRQWHEEPALQDLTASDLLHLSYHRCCHFGFQVGTQSKPSSACFVTASNVKLSGHPCRCDNKEAAAHEMDWNAATGRHTRAAVKQKMLVEIFKQSLTTSSSTIPDLKGTVQQPTQNISTTAAFPTAARQRQKERLKDDKTVVQKRRQKIEDHFDDCGSSLEGLRKICGDLELLTTELSATPDADEDDLWQPQLRGFFNSSCFYGYGFAGNDSTLDVKDMQQLEALLFYSARFSALLASLHARPPRQAGYQP